ncbi:MAG: fumarylacetoacetate hydrolase family protein, partial [Polyangia bacterium]
LLETPRQMLTRVCAIEGALPPGTLLLTGTPAGVALSVPRWKRVLGERLLDRAGRLRAAMASYGAGDRFLRPGDLVEVRAGFLGSIAHHVTFEPEPEPT